MDIFPKYRLSEALSIYSTGNKGRYARRFGQQRLSVRPRVHIEG